MFVSQLLNVQQIFSRRIQNRWFLTSVGTCRKNHIRRVRATTRRKGCVLEKARLSPTTRRVRDTRERRRDLPLRGYLPRDKDDERRRRYQGARGDGKREERIWMPGDKRGETSARACVCRSVGVRGYNERSRVEGRESESEGEEPGRGAERERDVGRGRERETGRKREDALSPTTGGENYPESAWGVRPRRRGEPSASEASAVPDTHQVPYGTRLEARTVRHSPLGDTTHAGPSSLWSTPASGNQHPRRRHQVAVPDSHISLPRPYVNEDAVSSHVDVDVASP